MGSSNEGDRLKNTIKSKYKSLQKLVIWEVNVTIVLILIHRMS